MYLYMYEACYENIGKLLKSWKFQTWPHRSYVGGHEFQNVGTKVKRLGQDVTITFKLLITFLLY